MKPFQYHQPANLEEVLSLLAQYGPAARIIAGGTDLVVQMRQGTAAPSHLISLKRVASLDSVVSEDGMGLSLGPLVTMARLEESQPVRDLFPALYRAAGLLGMLQTRNLATIGGNLCNASPASEASPALLVFGAQLEIAARGGTRTTPVSEFFVGPGETSLAKGEVLVRIHIPAPPKGARSRYVKFSPRACGDIAIVGVAVLLLMDEDMCVDARIGLGAVAPTPVRAPTAESLLKGERATPELARKVARAAAQECSPIDDHRASAAYRRHIVEVITGRTILELCAQEGKGV